MYRVGNHRLQRGAIRRTLERKLSAIDDHITSSPIIDENRLKAELIILKQRREELLSLDTLVQDELETECELEEHMSQAWELQATTIALIQRTEELLKHDQIIQPTGNFSSSNSQSSNPLLNQMSNASTSQPSNPTACQPTNKISPQSFNVTAHQVTNSAAPEIQLPSLKNEDIFRFKNKKAIDVVIPSAFNTLLKWGCNKTSGETFYDHLLSNMTSRSEKWLKKFEQKLKYTDGTAYDVTFLFELIPEACLNLDKNWKGIDNQRVEFWMTKAKDLRNEVVHEPKGTAISPRTLGDIEDTLVKLIQTAGNLYTQQQEHVDKEIDYIKQMISEIEKTMSDRDTKIAQIRRRMFTYGKKEQKECCDKYSKEILPFCKTKVTRGDIFHQLNLSMINEERQQTTNISCNQLFLMKNEHSEQERFIIMEGTAGSGKSTILKQIIQDYHTSNTTEIFCGVRKFKFLHYVECRDHQFGSFEKMMERKFKQTFKNILPGDAVEAAEGLSSLILIDGIDELNVNSRNLVWDIVKRFSNGLGTFVVTLRPIAGNDFKSQLDKFGISYITCTIQDIRYGEEQTTFLERYQEAIPEIKSPTLINTFRSLSSELRVHFVLPMSLALFCHLFKHSPDDVKEWISEHSVLQQTVELCKELMNERVHQQVKANHRILTLKVFECICHLSLCCLQQDKMFIDQKTYDKFCMKCYDNISNELQYDEIISCLFSMHCSPYSTRDNSYEYFHKSHQEFLAAIFLARKIEDSKESVKQILSEAIDSTLDNRSLKRYANVFKLTVIELSQLENKAPLTRHLPEFCELLKEAGVDLQYCAELVEGCQCSEQVARAVTTITDNQEWLVTSSRHIKGLAAMLSHCQPRLLRVLLESSQQTPPALTDLMNVAREQFQEGRLDLELHHSHDTFTPCDIVVAQLSNARLQLGWSGFKGCVSSSQAVHALACLLQTDTPLHISLDRPLQHSLLDRLNKRSHRLYVTTEVSISEVSINEIPTHGKRPLPQGERFPPHLTVTGCSGATWTTVMSFIRCLAPRDCRYWRLVLQDCQYIEEELLSLLGSLHHAGIRTTYRDSYTCWSYVQVGRDGRCQHCCSDHGEGHRCVELFLAQSSETERDHAQELPLTQTNIRRLQNKRMCDILIPRVLSKVIRWGCPKTAGETFWAFLECKHSNQEWKRFQKRWSDSEREQLLADSTIGFDVLLLVKLLPEVCDSISKATSDVWTAHYEGKLECLLKRVKDLRNEVMYEPDGGAVATGTSVDITSALVKVLQVAGDLYLVPQQNITNEVNLVSKATKRNEMVMKSMITIISLKDDDRNRFTNKEACDVLMPRILSQVIKWGCPKSPQQTFWDYLGIKNSLTWSSYSKKWKFDETKLLAVDTSGFDVTFLVRFIPEVCSDVDRYGTGRWKDLPGDGEVRIEPWLKAVEDLRSEVIQKPWGAAISSKILRDIKNTLRSLVFASGDYYKIQQSVVTNFSLSIFKY